MAFSFRVQTWVAAASLPQWFDYVSTQDLQELAYYDRTETAVRPGLMLIKLYLKDMPPSWRDLGRRLRRRGTSIRACSRLDR
jgi:hypothetical protein